MSTNLPNCKGDLPSGDPIPRPPGALVILPVSTILPNWEDVLLGGVTFIEARDLLTHKALKKVARDHSSGKSSVNGQEGSLAIVHATPIEDVRVDLYSDTEWPMLQSQSSHPPDLLVPKGKKSKKSKKKGRRS